MAQSPTITITLALSVGDKTYNVTVNGIPSDEKNIGININIPSGVPPVDDLPLLEEDGGNVHVEPEVIIEDVDDDALSELEEVKRPIAPHVLLGAPEVDIPIVQAVHDAPVSNAPGLRRRRHFDPSHLGLVAPHTIPSDGTSEPAAPVPLSDEKRELPDSMAELLMQVMSTADFLAIGRQRPKINWRAAIQTHTQYARLMQTRGQDLEMYIEVCTGFDEWIRNALKTEDADDIKTVQEVDIEFQTSKLKFVTRIEDELFARMMALLDKEVQDETPRGKGNRATIRGIFSGMRQGSLSGILNVLSTPNCTCPHCR